MLNILETGIGLDIIAGLREHIPAIVNYMLYPFHFIGEEYGYLLILPLIYWCIHKEQGKRVLILVLGMACLNNFLKTWWRRPRPFQVDPERVKPFFPEHGFGLPSGHSMLGALSGGLAFSKFKKAGAKVGAVIFALLMGFSRMAHGVHYPQDVLLGFLLGLGILFIYLWLDPHLTKIVERASIFRQSLAVLVLTLALFFMALGLGRNYEEQKSILSVGGALVGILFGFILESRFLGFRVNGKPGRRILRAIMGILTILILHLGLSAGFYAIVGENSGIFVLILYLLRYAIVGLWVALGAPFLFVRLKLATKQ